MALDKTHVFICYCHKDKRWLDRLHVHLRPLIRDGSIDQWDDTRLQPSVKWQVEIQAAISQSQIAILLVSADFLASDFIVSNELPPILEAAERNGITIISIIVSPCRFDETKSISQFQAVNNPQHPLTAMDKQEKEQVFLSLSRIIEQVSFVTVHDKVVKTRNPKIEPEQDISIDNYYITPYYVETYLQKRHRSWLEESKENYLDTKAMWNDSWKSLSEWEILLLRAIVPYLVAIVNSNHDYWITIEAIKILGILKIPNLEKLMLETFNENRGGLDIQIACINFLGQIGTPEARNTLEKFAIHQRKYNLPPSVYGAVIRSLKNLYAEKLPDLVIFLCHLLSSEYITPDYKKFHILPVLDSLDRNDAKSCIDTYYRSMER